MSSFLDATEIWLPGTLAMAALTVASGFFSASETALFYLSRDELRAFRVGKPRERMAATLLRNPDRLLTAILFWNLVTNLTYFTVSILVTRKLETEGHTAAGGLFGLGSLVAIIVFGEVLPKSLAIAIRKSLSSWVSFPLAAAVRVLDPVAPMLRSVTILVRRTLWPKFRAEPYLDTDDLERAVETTELSEDLIRQERQLLHNLLDLSEIPTEEVMRPRGSYLTFEPPVALSDLGGKIPPSGYVLLIEPGGESIEGAVPILNFSSLPKKNLEQSAEEVVVVPWCASLAVTLQLLRSQYCNVAEVTNEYGATIGIVTYEDILDTMLRAQPSRAKRLLRREPVVEIEPGRYRVDGITTLRYLCARLDLDFEPSDEGTHTVAGLLNDELERVPETGDSCHWRGYLFTVTDVYRPGNFTAEVRHDEPPLESNS
ncbi:CNNM domain-containing protein [Symmachiella dynata]|uniref:CNNM domain-containing protein n=1 Tax=Symmachiella dynata TaxID=2527995 RepID=UPI0030EC0232